jgi:hypothetical protein
MVCAQISFQGPRIRSRRCATSSTNASQPSRQHPSTEAARPMLDPGGTVAVVSGSSFMIGPGRRPAISSLRTWVSMLPYLRPKYAYRMTVLFASGGVCARPVVATTSANDGWPEALWARTPD